MAQHAMARNRNLEVKEPFPNKEERRAFAVAKRLEFASWVNNKVIELAVNYGAPYE